VKKRKKRELAEKWLVVGGCRKRMREWWYYSVQEKAHN